MKARKERARQFYRTYPIASALRSQFNWTQYKLLISISDPDKREYYELEAAKNFWTARELERQKNSLLYERLLCIAGEGIQQKKSPGSDFSVRLGSSFLERVVIPSNEVPLRRILLQR